MRTRVIQDWITVQLNTGDPGNVVTSTQLQELWLDVSSFAAATFWVDVSGVSLGNEDNYPISLTFQTSPTLDETYFFPCAQPLSLLQASSSPQIVQTVRAQAIVPLARYLRWQVSAISGTGNYSVTFRIRAAFSLESFFVPTDVGGCVLWLRADLGIAVSSGSAVSEWPDQSGIGNNFSQSSGPNQPIFQSNGGPNGTPYLAFETSNSTTLSCTSVVAQPNNGCTMFIVHQFTAVTPCQMSIAIGNSVWWGLDYSGIKERDVVVGGGGADYDSANSATTSWEQWSSTSNATTQTLRVNGTAKSLLTSYPPATATVGTYVGAVESFFYMTGGIAEIVVYNSVLSAAQVLRVENYLLNRYGL